VKHMVNVSRCWLHGKLCTQHVCRRPPWGGRARVHINKGTKGGGGRGLAGLTRTPWSVVGFMPCLA